MLLKFTYESEWLEARKKDVTSSEVAAMFGLHPHKSRLRLWHEKMGTIAPEFIETAHTKWGRRLQIPVGMGICEDEGWQGFDLTGYYARDPGRKLGASFDLKIKAPKKLPGLLEVKIAESFDEDYGWFKDKAPLQYEFQLQQQMHCLRADDSVWWGAIGTLGRRQATRLYMREYDAELGALIDQEAEDFWKSIQNNQEPKPDYSVDSDLIERLRKPLRAGDTIVLSQDNRAMELMHNFYNLSQKRDEFTKQIKPLETEMEAIKSEIWDKMGRNEKAIIGEFQVGARKQVVEEYFNSGSSFRRFDISKKRK